MLQNLWIKWLFQAEETFLAAELQNLEREAFNGALGTDENNVYVRYLGSICLQKLDCSLTSTYKCEFGGDN